MKMKKCHDLSVAHGTSDAFCAEDACIAVLSPLYTVWLRPALTLLVVSTVASICRSSLIWQHLHTAYSVWTILITDATEWIRESNPWTEISLAPALSFSLSLSFWVQLDLCIFGYSSRFPIVGLPTTSAFDWHYCSGRWHQITFLFAYIRGIALILRAWLSRSLLSPLPFSFSLRLISEISEPPELSISTNGRPLTNKITIASTPFSKKKPKFQIECVF